MRVKTLQVVWHGKEPVYSLDFHPSGILATGGADKEIKVKPLVEACFAALSPPRKEQKLTRRSYHWRAALQLWQVRCARPVPPFDIISSLWRRAHAALLSAGAPAGGRQPGRHAPVQPERSCKDRELRALLAGRRVSQPSWAASLLTCILMSRTV